MTVKNGDRVIATMAAASERYWEVVDFNVNPLADISNKWADDPEVHIFSGALPALQDPDPQFALSLQVAYKQRAKWPAVADPHGTVQTVMGNVAEVQFDNGPLLRVGFDSLTLE